MSDERKPTRPGHEWRTCERCKGSKVDPGSVTALQPYACSMCEGKGECEVCVDGSDFVGGA